MLSEQSFFSGNRIFSKTVFFSKLICVLNKKNACWDFASILNTSLFGKIEWKEPSVDDDFCWPFKVLFFLGFFNSHHTVPVSKPLPRMPLLFSRKAKWKIHEMDRRILVNSFLNKYYCKPKTKNSIVLWRWCE